MSTGLCLLPRQECGLALKQVHNQLAFENGDDFINVCLLLQTLRVAQSCRKKYAASLAKLIPPNHALVASHPICIGMRSGSGPGWALCLWGKSMLRGAFRSSIFGNTLPGVNQYCCIPLG